MVGEITFIALFAVFSVFCRQSYAASVTICDSGCNYNTISSALAALGNGSHSITVQAPYTAAEATTIKVSGTDFSNRLVIQVRLGDVVSITRLMLDGDNIVIKNFNFVGSSNDCITVASGKSNITVDNNTFRCSVAKSSPLRLYQDIPLNANIIITNNKFYNIGYVLFIGGKNVLFENNLIDGNNSSTGYTSDSIWTYGDNVVIRGNEIRNLVNDGVNHVDFIQSSGSAQPNTGSSNIIVEDNYWHDGDAQLCNLSNDTNSPNYGGWTFRNNIFKNIRYRCNVGLPDVKIYNNTLDNVDWDPSHRYGGTFYGWLGDGGTKCNNIEIKNNISVGGYLWLPLNDCPNSVADYNMITSSTFGTVANQFEVHGINGGDPKFINRSNNNYKLKVGSPAINAGVVLNSFSWDMKKIYRPQGKSWDMGAHEFVFLQSNPPYNLSVH
jgi:hypothetical protein